MTARVRPGRRPARQGARTPARQPLSWPLLALGLLAAATLATFAGVLANEWLLTDDPYYVTRNPMVARGLHGEAVGWAFRGPHVGNWHPLTSLTHMAAVSLFGLQPAGHHGVNWVLHAANAVLAALVFHAYTGAWWRSLFVAAFFALHPLRVESVAWVSELKDLLSGLFFLLSLLAYRAWVARPSPGRYGVLLGCFALALMAKPMAVTLPLVLLLLDAWPLARLQGHWRERLLEKVPLLVLALLDGVLTVAAQGQAGAMVSFATTGVATRVANAALNPWRYLADTFWPAHLAIFHPIEPVRTEVVTLSLFALGLVTVLVWLQRRVRPYLAVGWLWYLGMLLPVLGIIQVGNQAYADRYTYLPSLGILLAVVWGVADRSMPRGWPHRLALGMAFLGLAASATASRRQISYWRDTKTLYRHALAVTPDNATAECTLGVALLEADSLSAAIGHLERALVLQPGWVYAEANLGVALLNANHPSAAIPHLERAATSMPSAMRYDQLGFAYAAVGRLDDAEAQLSRALRLEPTNAYALIDMGQVLAARGRVAAAESLFQRAAAVAPTDESVRRMLAVARASVASGRFTMRW